MFFYDDAKNLMSWYKPTSNRERFAVVNMLLGCVWDRGGRFLKRNKKHHTGGAWLEIDHPDTAR
jgi:hypothetical protein